MRGDALAPEARGLYRRRRYQSGDVDPARASPTQIWELGLPSSAAANLWKRGADERILHYAGRREGGRQIHAQIRRPRRAAEALGHDVVVHPVSPVARRVRKRSARPSSRARASLNGPFARVLMSSAARQGSFWKRPSHPPWRRGKVVLCRPVSADSTRALSGRFRVRFDPKLHHSGWKEKKKIGCRWRYPSGPDTDPRPPSGNGGCHVADRRRGDSEAGNRSL